MSWDVQQLPADFVLDDPNCYTFKHVQTLQAGAAA